LKGGILILVETGNASSWCL